MDQQNIQSQQPNITPQPTASSSQQKPLIYILAAALVIALGAFGYMLWQNQKGGISPSPTPSATQTPLPTASQPSADNETTNWQIYKNEQYYYSIQYPKSFTPKEFPDGPGSPGGIILLVDNRPIIDIGIRGRATADKAISFADYVKIAASHEIQGYESLRSIEKVTTNSGEVGYKTIWNGTSPDGSAIQPLPITYFDAKNDNKDTIQIILSDKKYLNEYNQILSTFKFNETINSLSVYEEEGRLRKIDGDNSWYFVAIKYNPKQDNWAEDAPIKLIFTDESLCQSAINKQTNCAGISLHPSGLHGIGGGSEYRVEGTRSGNKVTVNKLVAIQ